MFGSSNKVMMLPEAPLSPRFLLQPPVFYPFLPYTTFIFGGVYPGKIITIQGKVPNDCNRFQVDFQYGSSVQPRADITMHFNPRFENTAHVICNTLENERWGSEEKTSPLPLRKGDDFHIVFMFHKENVKVSVNGKHLLKYRHRIPMDYVDTLSVSGKVKVKAIGFFNNNPYSEEETEYPVCSTLPLNNAHPQMPFICKLNRALDTGHMITIRGLVHKDPDEFIVLLKCLDSDDTPLKLCASFKRKDLIRKSFQDGVWSHEECEAPFFPFHPERFFEVLILCTDQGFKVALNGNPFLSYTPQKPMLNQIRVLEVYGNVDLYNVKV
ncbi:galectin-12 [Protopterus annectens]|uniref:galectin-12 n=1 Tax=Protopterus annectens TaxID=7888 RepID=UPI001CF9BA5C|nr:galectin-12 [Protopterus annectens]